LRAGDGSLESLGARLKKEREQRKITLDDISLSTKIAPRFLTAIEEEQFDQLPGGIFNKGFVRSYARYLGIDENQAVADYVAETTTALPESPQAEIPQPKVPEVRQRGSGGAASGIPWEVLAVGLLIIAFGFAVWGFHSREKRAQPVSAPQPADAASSTTTSASVNDGEPPQPVAPENSKAAPQSTAPPEVAASASPAPTHLAPQDPGAFLVQIKAREDSWLVVSADGKEIMQDTLHASAEKSVGARNQIVIKTGNAGALDISFNGRKLPTQGSDNEVKTLLFDPNGLRSPGTQARPGTPPDTH
jgi:cytoskeleton protein RodZ